VASRENAGAEAPPNTRRPVTRLCPGLNIEIRQDITAQH